MASKALATINSTATSRSRTHTHTGLVSLFLYGFIYHAESVILNNKLLGDKVL